MVAGVAMLALTSPVRAQMAMGSGTGIQGFNNTSVPWTTSFGTFSTVTSASVSINSTPTTLTPPEGARMLKVVGVGNGAERLYTTFSGLSVGSSAAFIVKYFYYAVGGASVSVLVGNSSFAAVSSSQISDNAVTGVDGWRERVMSFSVSNYATSMRIWVEGGSCSNNSTCGYVDGVTVNVPSPLAGSGIASLLVAGVLGSRRWFASRRTASVDAR